MPWCFFNFLLSSLLLVGNGTRPPPTACSARLGAIAGGDLIWVARALSNDTELSEVESWYKLVRTPTRELAISLLPTVVLFVSLLLTNSPHVSLELRHLYQQWMAVENSNRDLS